MMFSSEFLCIFLYPLVVNLCVLNSNLSDNILYLVTFTYKLAKHKTQNGCQNVKKPLYFLCFFCKFFLYISFLVYLERNNLYFTSKYKVLLLL